MASAKQAASELERKFGSLRFEEKYHRYYFDGKDVPLISATSFVHGKQPPFDSETISAAVARKQGRTKTEVLEEWQFKNDFSKALGSWIHSIIEAHVRDFQAGVVTDCSRFMPGVPKANKKRAVGVAANAVRMIRAVLKEWEPVAVEFRVFDLDCLAGETNGNRAGLAGTVDAMLRNRESGKFWIFDWKTNEKLKFSGFKGKRMLEPFADLEACNINEYRIQLSLYKEMIERAGVCLVEGLKLGYVTEEGHEFITLKEVDVGNRMEGWKYPVEN